MFDFFSVNMLVMYAFCHNSWEILGNACFYKDVFLCLCFQMGALFLKTFLHIILQLSAFKISPALDMFLYQLGLLWTVFETSHRGVACVAISQGKASIVCS